MEVSQQGEKQSTYPLYLTDGPQFRSLRFLFFPAGQAARLFLWSIRNASSRCKAPEKLYSDGIDRTALQTKAEATLNFQCRLHPSSKRSKMQPFSPTHRELSAAGTTQPRGSLGGPPPKWLAARSSNDSQSPRKQRFANTCGNSQPAAYGMGI